MKLFFDTNIIVYAHDSSDPRKQIKARELLTQAIENRDGVVSMQVVSEFTNVALRKFKSKQEIVELDDAYDSIFEPLLTQLNDTLYDFKNAAYLSQRYQLSYYDARIVQSAIANGCSTLYSEDLQHEQTIEGVTITNPFCED
jgi:predicted nucleic acid-binding protein